MRPVGYNEVEMAIRHRVFREPVPASRTTTGTVIRFWEEMDIDDGSLHVSPGRPYEAIS